LTGCAQQVIDSNINDAAIRLLNRHGIEVTSPRDEGCCGALVYHMGYEESALEAARRNVDAWTRELDESGLDAIVITASGCGTSIKDYGYILREDKAYARKAARISALAQDISEYLHKLQLQEPVRTTVQIVAYHSACSMQHGQRIVDQPKSLLTQMGFVVKDVPESRICCGSAGTFNILQPEIANRLRSRKVANIEKVRPQIIASGNLGCMTQIGAGTVVPIVHTVELLDWATGGPLPGAMKDRFS
jgi:glycolate oxidase iron-sulfur subunit